MCEKCAKLSGGMSSLESTIRLAVGEVLAVASCERSPNGEVDDVLEEFGATYLAFADSTTELVINERIIGIERPSTGLKPHVVMHQVAHLALRRGHAATDDDPTGEKTWPEFLRTTDDWNDHGPLWAGMYVSMLRESLGWKDAESRFRDAGVDVAPNVPPDMARRIAIKRGMSTEIATPTDVEPRVYRRYTP